jgi:hypothetical protein
VVYPDWLPVRIGWQLNQSLRLSQAKGLHTTYRWILVLMNVAVHLHVSPVTPVTDISSVSFVSFAEMLG